MNALSGTDTSGDVLLLSGGLDSTCVAAWRRPAHCLGIDYGQRAAAAEHRAASAVARRLHIPFNHITVDASAVGGGLMSRHPAPTGPTPEWWPFRNQLLITVAAAWATTRGHHRLLVGTVAGDGDRHTDGTPAFYAAMTALLKMQEGNVEVTAPAITLPAHTLIEVSTVDDATLGLTHSCHVGDVPCAQCPGCTKRADVLARAGRLQ